MYTSRNVMLSKMIAQVENYFHTCGEMSDKELRENIENLLSPKNKKKDEKNFIYYIKEFIKTKRKPGTILTYEQTVKKIESLIRNVLSLNPKLANFVFKAAKIFSFIKFAFKIMHKVIVERGSTKEL